MNNEAASLIRFLKSNLGLPFHPVIAGGFARDQILGVKARDIDVFLLGNFTRAHVRNQEIDEYVGETTELVCQTLASHYVQSVVEPKNYRPIDDSVPTFGPPVNFQFLQWPVQLIVTPCTSEVEVVQSFDYNICQFWLDRDDLQPVGLTSDHLAALVHRDMRLLHTRTPWSSLRRGILLADRFGFTFNEQDKKSLVEALHAELSA